MSATRERFERWAETKTTNPLVGYSVLQIASQREIAWQAWQAATADMDELREKLRLARLEIALYREYIGDGDEETIEDGFGSVWPRQCCMCKLGAMQVVRPGNATCAICDSTGIEAVLARYGK